MAYACFQVTEKLVPLLDSAEGCAFTVPPRPTITISSAVEDGNEALIEPVVPPMVALADVKVTVPKFARGKILPADGASAIHSADVACAPDTV